MAPGNWTDRVVSRGETILSKRGANSAIETSSDAWSSLVTNLAPILTLVGEKHVKAYFKIMTRQPHYFLFAAAPIGLITAVTTLIRLIGSDPMRRLIGRQFETEAEILAEVTSVSYGKVSLVLKDNKLEQTISPSPEDLAKFYARGVFTGPPLEMLQKRSKVCKTIFKHCHLNVVEENSRPVVRQHWISYLSASPEEDAISRLRKFSIMPAEPKDLAQFNSGSPVSGATAYLLSCPGVSLSLTANHSSHILIEVSRFLIPSFCVVCNFATIAMNWKFQHDIQNTVFNSVGLAMTIVTAYITAIIVDYMSEETKIDLKEFSSSECWRSGAGFFSQDSPLAVPLSTVPKAAIVSVSRKDGFYLFGNRDLQSLSAVIVTAAMVCGYLLLYLGLRTSEWWVPLTILAVSVAASLSRALLPSLAVDLLRDSTAYSPTLNPSASKLPAPSFSPSRRLNIHRLTGDDLLTPLLSPPSTSSITSSDCGGNLELSNYNVEEPNKNAEKYVTIFCTGQPFHPRQQDHPFHHVERKRSLQFTVPGQLMYWLNYVPLDIAIRMKERSLLPAELREDDLKLFRCPLDKDHEILKRDLTYQVIYSDLLKGKSVNRQPLEIIVQHYHEWDDAFESLEIAIEAWILPAARNLYPQEVRYIADLTRQSCGRSVNANSSFPFIWTAAKIAMGIFSEWTPEKLQKLKDKFNSVGNDAIKDDSQPKEHFSGGGFASIDNLLDHLSDKGLVVEKPRNEAKIAPGPCKSSQ